MYGGPPPIELWAASSLLRGGGGLRWPTFKPLHHSLLSTALPRSPLAKEKTSCSQRCTSPSSENSRIGQIEQRSENINLHYPPLVIHFLIAQNLWPPLIAGICLVVPKFVAAAPNHQTGCCTSIAPITALLVPPHCSISQLGYLECMAFTGCPRVQPCPHWDHQCRVSAMHQNATSANSPKSTVFAPKSTGGQMQERFPINGISAKAQNTDLSQR